MNIFATSPCPKESALYLDPRRRNKMIVESQQMLAAVMYRHSWMDCLPLKVDTGEPYKLTHPNHPCTIWAGNSGGNFYWLISHLEYLYTAYVEVDGGTSHTNVISNIKRMLPAYSRFTDKALYQFQNSARRRDLNLDFTHLPVHQAYKEYLKAREELSQH